MLLYTATTAAYGSGTRGLEEKLGVEMVGRGGVCDKQQFEAYVRYTLIPFRIAQRECQQPAIPKKTTVQYVPNVPNYGYELCRYVILQHYYNQVTTINNCSCFKYDP